MGFEESEKLRDVSRKADEGDIRSIYQMYINYLQGEYTKKDLLKSKQYLELLRKQTSGGKLLLKSIALHDFRGLETLRLSFNSSLTVIIGNNGTGKTTLLEAIALSLSWLKANILREDGKGNYIKESDINTKKTVNYAAINTKLSYVKRPFDIMLSKAKEGSTLKRTNELLSIKLLAGIFKHLNDADNNTNLPLLAYYPVSRSNEGSGIDLKKQNKEKKVWTKFDAYEDVLADRHDFGEFINWFIFINNLANQNSSSNKDNRIIKLKSELDASIIALEQIRLLGSFPDSILAPLEEGIKTKKLEILDLQNKKIAPQTLANDKIKLINYAFGRFLPELKDIKVHYSETDIKLILVKEDMVIEAQQLSQGEKSILTLVGDLVRRLVILNPHLTNPLEGDGIVLIDEIDLHLHPRWQQKIIKNLQTVFPNIQFVISTHSPQVLSTVLSSSIRIIKTKKINNFNSFVVVEPSFQTKGVMSADILAEIMDTDPKPYVIESIWLDEYKKNIELDNDESPEAKLLWMKLVKHFGEDHPLIFECLNLKSVQEMKKRLLSLKNKKEAD